MATEDRRLEEVYEGDGNLLTMTIRFTTMTMTGGHGRKSVASCCVKTKTRLRQKTSLNSQINRKNILTHSH